MAPKTVDLVYGTLRRIMRLAEANRIIDHSPCTIMVKLPKLPPKRERYLPVTEAADLIASVSESIRLTVFLAAVLGLRKGEVAGLQWSKIDRSARSIRIDQQRTAEGKLKQLKNDSKRTMTVPQAFQDFIDRFGDLDNKQGYVCTRAGLPWVPNTIYEHWRSWADKNSYEDWTYHDLRHLAAGLIASATGGNVLAVQAVLGHASIDMTAVYLAKEAAQIGVAFEGLEALTHGKCVSKRRN